MSDKVYGNIFKVGRKASPGAPDHRGSFNISKEFIRQLSSAPTNSMGQVEVDFAGWKKEGPKAGVYISGNLSIPTSEDKRKREEYRQKYNNGGDHKTSTSGGRFEEEDEIPF